MGKILTLGEIVVEILSKNKNQNYVKEKELLGPYPSGAPAIFIDQVAKIGSECSIFSCVGNDDFGKVNLLKLQEDGVDISNIHIDNELSTGVAFVNYKENGDRDFIFHLKNAACGKLNISMIKEEDFKDCSYFHVMGSSLFNENLRMCCKKAIEICKSKNIKISFDPNIRKELLNDSNMKEFLLYVYKNCDIFLPSESEISIFTNIDDEEKSIKKVIEDGKEIIVLKKGSKGCIGYYNGELYSCSAISIEEVDATGAGDCFSGTLISCLNKGIKFKDALNYANVAGALAVSKKGPMSGNSTLDEIKNILNK